VNFPGIGTGFATLPGVSAQVSIKVKDSKLSATSPLLITHWGMSGPAILKLSAWGARILHDKNSQFTHSSTGSMTLTLMMPKNPQRFKTRTGQKSGVQKIAFRLTKSALGKFWYLLLVLKQKQNGRMYRKSNCKTWPVN
jgi:predicted flavoprotein YhiN